MTWSFCEYQALRSIILLASEIEHQQSGIRFSILVGAGQVSSYGQIKFKGPKPWVTERGVLHYPPKDTRDWASRYT